MNTQKACGETANANGEAERTVCLLMMQGLSPHITRRIVAVRVSHIRMQSFMSLELLGTLV